VGIVITTDAISESFANGMEFFSSFGGSTVACKVTTEVLKITEEENLQHNAKEMGQILKQGFLKLSQTYDIISDVRGRGLFWGLEIVLSRDTKEPATNIASFISNRLKVHHILIGTDGIYDNVLKIRPPLVINKRDCELFLFRLDAVLHEAMKLL